MKNIANTVGSHDRSRAAIKPRVQNWNEAGCNEARVQRTKRASWQAASHAFATAQPVADNEVPRSATAAERKRA